MSTLSNAAASALGPGHGALADWPAVMKHCVIGRTADGQKLGKKPLSPQELQKHVDLGFPAIFWAERALTFESEGGAVRTNYDFESNLALQKRDKRKGWFAVVDGNIVEHSAQRKATKCNMKGVVFGRQPDGSYFSDISKKAVMIMERPPLPPDVQQQPAAHPLHSSSKTDRFYTPAELAARLAQHVVRMLPGHDYIDCGVGAGAIYDEVLRQMSETATLVGIERHQDTDVGDRNVIRGDMFDVTSAQLNGRFRSRVLVGNPPFSNKEWVKILKHFARIAQHAVFLIPQFQGVSTAAGGGCVEQGLRKMGWFVRSRENLKESVVFTGPDGSTPPLRMCYVWFQHVGFEVLKPIANQPEEAKANVGVISKHDAEVVGSVLNESELQRKLNAAIQSKHNNVVQHTSMFLAAVNPEWCKKMLRDAQESGRFKDFVKEAGMLASKNLSETQLLYGFAQQMLSEPIEIPAAPRDAKRRRLNDSDDSDDGKEDGVDGDDGSDGDGDDDSDSEVDDSEDGSDDGSGDEHGFVVEKILNDRVNFDSGEREHFIKWGGYQESENSWGPLASLDGCPDLLAAYQEAVQNSIEHVRQFLTAEEAEGLFEELKGKRDFQSGSRWRSAQGDDEDSVLNGGREAGGIAKGCTRCKRVHKIAGLQRTCAKRPAQNVLRKTSQIVKQSKT